MRKLILLAATGGGAGYLPGAPGSVGSVLGVALWAGLARWGPGATLAGAALGAALAIWVAGRAQDLLGQPDDQRIVIDEVAGALLALAALPLRWDTALLGFALFRVLDIAKPPPCRRIEQWAGGVGVVGDDLVAGLYANTLGQLAVRLVLPEGAS
jgi:phosphatidylglycerophosphatase A